MRPAASPPRPDGTDGAAARLRSDIDHGRTGDKNDWPDPAAAPLGTDDEAAASTPPPQAVEGARSTELARPSHRLRRHGRIGAAWIMVGIVAVAAAGTALWIAAMSS